MSAPTFLEQRLDASTWPIAVGDLLFILAFIFAGTVRHWTLEAVLEDPFIFANAAAPFVLGWLIAAPLVGAYSPGGGSAPNSSVPLAVRSWIPAAVIGLAIRATPVFQGGVQVSFALVMILGGAVVLAVWRFLYFKLR